MTRRRTWIRVSRAGAIALAVILSGQTATRAHELTINGVVAVIERDRIHVSDGGAGSAERGVWYPINDSTKFLRGKTLVKREDARMATGEPVVLLVDHREDSTMLTLEVRLRER